MKKIFYLLLIFISSINLEAFDGLLFKPPAADPLEPRVGAIVEYPEKKLRLDIGISVDLTEFNLKENGILRIGTDFFTLTRLRSEGNMKFPVETSDYFFGINASYLFVKENVTHGARLRVAHISSHLVDGYTHDSTFLKRPFVYSREFAELIYAIQVSSFRAYAGFNYVFSTKPKDVEPVIPQIGFDINKPLNNYINFVGGYDFKLSGADKTYMGINAIQAGILLKTYDNIGVLLSLYYYSGRNLHGMFYNEYNSYTGVGFQVYFY